MKKILAAVLMLMLVLGCLAACGGEGDSTTAPSVSTPGSGEVKDNYIVTYIYNYEGSAPDKAVTVPAGTRTTNLKLTRAGYKHDGWYTNAECTGTPFDFSQYINADVKLYAKWTKNAEQYTVTFNYNYSGAGDAGAALAEEGSPIKSSSIPECPRLGMQYEGWYKDADCTQPWNMETDVVTGNMTLYAKYTYDETIARNEDGSIKFEGVVINVWANQNFNTGITIDRLVSKFNKEYEGKIKVVFSYGDTLNQDTTSLRLQQVGNVPDAAVNYYSVEEVYALAGLTYDPSIYYEKAIRDAYFNGTQYTVPLAASVPYIIYNKDLMAKYNGSEELPDTYEEFVALLQKAYEGEYPTNKAFHSIETGKCWTFKENASFASFMQNGVPYYQYKDGQMMTVWADEAYDAQTEGALTNMFNLFGLSGSAHGWINGDNYDDGQIRASINAGNCLMGIINWSPNVDSVINGDFGIMPLSGLFASEGVATKDYIPVSNIGFQFYRAKNVDLTAVAACALFADYVSQNSVEFASYGWYPLNKNVVASEDWSNKLLPAYQEFWSSVGDPENFVSHDGFSVGKSIYNTNVAEGFLVNLMQDRFADPDTVKLYWQRIRDTICAQF